MASIAAPVELIVGLLKCRAPDMNINLTPLYRWYGLLDLARRRTIKTRLARDAFASVLAFEEPERSGQRSAFFMVVSSVK